MLRPALILYFLLFLSMPCYGENDMIIKLPEPNLKGAVSLEESIKNRRSERSLSGKELTMEQIGQLLWSCQGITGDNKKFRSAPSAGATHPLEIYIVSKNGFFQYLPDQHSIKRLKTGDLRETLCGACFGQDFVRDAAIDIIIAADFQRTTSRYGERGEGYVYIEVGHAAQNLHLQAVALGLGSVPVGAFSDDSVRELLGLPKNINPLYIVPIGYTKK